MKPEQFRAVDEDRLAVARDRSIIRARIAAATAQSEEVLRRASRLIERDKENGFTELWIKLLGEGK